MPLQIVIIGWISVGDQRIVVFWISSIQVFATGSTLDGKVSIADKHE